jgi:hypothetical protein
MTKGIPLEGKRILYAAPRFFGYDQDIADELSRRGAEVVRLFDRPFDTPMMTAVTKLAPGAIARAASPLYRAIIEEHAHFDIFLVVNGQTLSGAFLNEVRRNNPRAIFILYVWDGLRNRGSIVPNLAKYDHVLGFDRSDAQEYGFAYRPLFFIPAFDESGSEASRHDISFIGTAHSDRAPIVHALDEMLPPEIRRFWYLFLQAPWVRRYYAIRSTPFRRVPPALFHYNPLSKEAISQVFRQSRAILDIEHPLQRGLTMRTFETLGAGKKLITTNPYVMEEDFYDPRNVLVINRRRIEIKRDFFEQPFVPVSPAIRQRYSIAGWLDDILTEGGVGTNAASLGFL